MLYQCDVVTSRAWQSNMETKCNKTERDTGHQTEETPHYPELVQTRETGELDIDRKYSFNHFSFTQG